MSNDFIEIGGDVFKTSIRLDSIQSVTIRDKNISINFLNSTVNTTLMYDTDEIAMNVYDRIKQRL